MPSADNLLSLKCEKFITTNYNLSKHPLLTFLLFARVFVCVTNVGLKKRWQCVWRVLLPDERTPYI
jgi:hypothetical protein